MIGFETLLLGLIVEGQLSNGDRVGDVSATFTACGLTLVTTILLSLIEPVWYKL